MHFVSNERIAIIIDGPNLHASTRELGFDVDFRRLLAFFRSQARLARALYFTTLIEDHEGISLRPLVDWLAYNGFSVVSKPAKSFTDGDGRRRVRGSMHVELAVEALSLAPSLDHVVIFTGDGAFKALVDALQQVGKRVSIVSTLASGAPLVSDELRRQADQFIDLAQLASEIARASPAPIDSAQSISQRLTHTTPAAEARPAKKRRSRSTSASSATSSSPPSGDTPCTP